jgi:hypothetical protein
MTSRVKNFKLEIPLKPHFTDTEIRKEEIASTKPSQVASEKSKTSQKGVGVHMMVFTLISTRIGMGIIGVPYATLQVGFLFSLIFQMLYITASVFVIWMLLKAKNMTGKGSISEL